MGLIDQGLIQRALQEGQVFLRGTGLAEHVLQVEEGVVILAAQNAVVHLHVLSFEIQDAGAVAVEEGAAGGGQGLQGAAVDHRDRRSVHRIVLVCGKIVHASRLQVRDFRLEEMSGERLVIEPGARNLARRDGQVGTHVPEFPGHLHRGHQARVEEDVVQFVRDGGREVLDLDFLGLGTGRIVLLSESLPPGTPVDGTAAVILAVARTGIAEISFRKPSGGVRRHDGAVTCRREVFLHPVEHFGHHRGVGDGLTDGPDLEGVGPEPAVVGIEADHGRSRFGGIVPRGLGQVAEEQEDVVILVLSGKVALLKVVDVGPDVAAQRIEAGLVQEHHLPVSLRNIPVGAHVQGEIQPVPHAGAESEERLERQKYVPDLRHKIGSEKQS